MTTTDPALLEPADDGKQVTVDVLLRRMQTESDLPALSEAIGAINRIASSDREGVNELSNNILKDFALTSKLLKLANVAYYNQVGGGSISTISRAVMVLGFDAVRSIALSLILFDNLKNKAHAQQLKEEFVKVLYAGMLAREMADKTQIKDGEEAFISAMLHRPGAPADDVLFPRRNRQRSSNAFKTTRQAKPRPRSRYWGCRSKTWGWALPGTGAFPISSCRA